MKQRVVTLVVLLFVCVGSIALAAWVQQSTATAREQQAKVQQTAGTANSYEYMMKEHEGRLAVYKKNSTEPDMVFDLLVKMLPQYDQDQLRQGIYVKDYRELVDLIEDYIS